MKQAHNKHRILQKQSCTAGEGDKAPSIFSEMQSIRQRNYIDLNIEPSGERVAGALQKTYNSSRNTMATSSHQAANAMRSWRTLLFVPLLDCCRKTRKFFIYF